MDFSNWNDDPEQFMFYFNAHYAPLLNKLADNAYKKIELEDKDKRLLTFMRDDLTKIFYQGDENG